MVAAIERKREKHGITIAKRGRNRAKWAKWAAKL
jgi:hypothetical protein